MLEQAGKRRKPAADGGRLGLIDLAHDALPGNHGAVVHLAQLVVGRDMQRAHEVPHVELVGAAGAFAFLLGEPDFFFGDVGERGEGRNDLARSFRTGGGNTAGADLGVSWALRMSFTLMGRAGDPFCARQ